MIYENNGIYTEIQAEIVDVMGILLSSSVRRGGRQRKSFKWKKANSMPVSKNARWRIQGSLDQSSSMQSLGKLWNTFY